MQLSQLQRRLLPDAAMVSSILVLLRHIIAVHAGKVEVLCPVGILGGAAVDVRLGKDKLIYLRHLAEESKSLYNSPLYRRGWALQETVLSNRIIHFASDQIFWSCQECLESEDGTYCASQSRTFADLSSLDKAHESWWTWVEDYSNRELTFLHDKFAAFAGLTQRFREVTDMEPVAGLWTQDIHFGLLWILVDGARRLEAAGLAGIPSWSWASVAGSVRTLTTRGATLWVDHSNGVENNAKVLNVEVGWSGKLLASSITRGRIS
jgi:hypothetical protein